MFVNLSNHPVSGWPKEQIDAAREYGEIVDLPFPAISPFAGSEEIDGYVDEYYERVTAFTEPTVMLMGEYVFTYRLARKLKNAGLRVVASCTERYAEERKKPDGTIEKVSLYRFVRFREY